jgi:hypothetical protein
MTGYTTINKAELINQAAASHSLTSLSASLHRLPPAPETEYLENHVLGLKVEGAGLAGLLMLGTFIDSGPFYVHSEAVVGDGAGVAPQSRPEEDGFPTATGTPLLLGTFIDSGPFYVDSEALVGDGAGLQTNITGLTR